MEHQEENAISRTYNWQQQKIDKISALAEEANEKEAEDLKNITAKLNYVNPNIFAVSKVKQFVESYKDESLTHSFKRDYKEGVAPTRDMTPVHQRNYKTDKPSSTLERKPIVADKKNDFVSFFNLIKKDGTSPSNVNSKQLDFEVLLLARPKQATSQIASEIPTGC